MKFIQTFMLLESIRKPTEEDKEAHKEGGKLYYVVVSGEGKRLGFIDEEYVKKISEKEGKKYSPLGAAKRRLQQVEYFKK